MARMTASSQGSESINSLRGWAEMMLRMSE